MTTGTQRRIRELFDAASDLPPADRMAWLDRQRLDDPQIYAAVSKLLKAASESAGFLAKPAWKRQEAPEREGRRIGPYKILRELGSGGMGVVYLSVRDDDVFHRLAALKIVRPEFGSGALQEKFRQERQMLANLDHPNIARILDGGTTEDGLPYLVMDYVEGEPIDAFCNSRRATLTQRLNLTGQMCKAVDYLHANHVLHRDLKPANILVTKDGLVKLLDFGIAKYLDQNFEATATGLPLMTPGYASPEQVLSKAMAPSSDVYSLGAILYLLLTGRRPLDLEGKTLPEVVKIVSAQDPLPASSAVVSIKPADEAFAVPGAISAWKNELEGDLNRIVAMALRKEPARRYQSAAELAADLRRFQQNEPVVARGNSPVYVAAKFFRRNRVTAIAGLIVAAALSVAGVAVGEAYHLYKVVNDLRGKASEAQQAFEQIRKVAPQGSYQQDNVIRGQLQQMQKTYQQELGPMLSSPLAPRHEIARLTGDTVSYLDTVAPVAAEKPDLAKAVANAYLTVSKLQWSAQGESLRDPAAARATAESALNELRPVLTDSVARQSLGSLLGAVERQVAASSKASGGQ